MAAADADAASAAAASAWHPLPLPASPALLVSARVAASSYVVRLTDMANVWEESLSSDGICARSTAENTSIDPSDTPENMARFLASLVSALDPLRPGHGDTSLCLTPASGRDDDGGLVLTVTCPLTGFAPLTWPIHLTKCPPSAVATHLVLPLFRSHHAGQLVIESLVQVLGYKDAVIAKMADKLEALGTGLEQVFPSLLGRSKVTRSAAGGKVKGLAPFDRAQFGLGSTEGSARLQALAGLGDGHFASEGWWRDFGKSRKHMSHDGASLPYSAKATGQDGDNEFQVQATPPGLASVAEPSGDNQAESLIPDSYPTAFAPPPTHHVPEKATSTFLGTIGGKTSTISTAQAKGSESAVDDSETASEASDDDATASAGSDACPSSSAANAATTDVKRGVIGSIGGKRVVEECPGASHDRNPSRKVGVIGGIGRSPPSKPWQEEIDRGSLKVSNDVHRETSQERADCRREEIKRDLERKAASGPAKKKRRF
ncbi:hypothetical protein L249_0460 [Ophiocordyceps polyrhachis-furcata BCC 54312]|uniref:Non-homologous end-joining factor 1 n=1 Tax=Ophiocordyceps polyrhachis-furcata BCC 54312 TaxID=1330021 RepID=A0A367LF14_9HYPO|nr:hypothetical protein L249_0460 [Ophiocordyceps polyrhachis-furcata BCC 54312]